MEISTIHALRRRCVALLTPGWMSLRLLIVFVWSNAGFAQPGPPIDPANVPVSAAESREVVLALAKVIRERFAFQDRAADAARAIESLQRKGTFRTARTAAELLALIKSHVTPLVNDQHFRAKYFGREAVAAFTDAPPSAQEIEAFHEEIRLRGGEVPEVRWLAGNVGYVRISRFMDAKPSAEKLATALAMLADTGALIIDVQDTPGGEPAGVANAIGHLVKTRTATISLADPHLKSTRTFYAEPKTPNFGDKPIYVLINAKTGSGAEEFVYDLQAMGRATLVGTTTSGAATPGGYRPLAHGFVAFIPMGIVRNAITGKNWEGVGVRPDVEVGAKASLACAHRLALEAILLTAQGMQRDISTEGLASLGAAAEPTCKQKPKLP